MLNNPVQNLAKKAALDVSGAVFYCDEMPTAMANYFFA
jgi:hypothetical protein